jgi:hypothetical protein
MLLMAKLNPIYILIMGLLHAKKNPNKRKTDEQIKEQTDILNFPLEGSL